MAEDMSGWAPEDAAKQLIRDGDLGRTELFFREHPEFRDLRVNSGRTFLHFAASRNQPELVRSLYRSGIPLNTTDDSGECPLSHAARHGDVELVRWMLEQGANPAISQWPMIDAVSTGILEVVRLFVERGADHRFVFGDPPRTLISQATDYGHPQVAAYLRSLEAAPPTATATAAGLGDFVLGSPPPQAAQTVEPKDLFAFADLILEKDLAGIEERLRAQPELLHARTFDMDETWLHYAATEGNMELVRYFYELGIPLNTTNKTSDRECPLSAAISEGSTEAVEWMLARGADPTLSNAPMISAVSRGKLEIVRRLVALGADYNFTFGLPPRTPLSQALDFGHQAVADYLRSLDAVMPNPQEEDEKEIEGSDFDLHEEIKEYFTHHFDTPPLPLGLQEIIPGEVNISVWTVVPKTGESKVIFTSGASEKPLNVPEGFDEYRYAELLMRLPRDWPSQPDLNDTAHSWPWVWLRAIAHNVHEQGTWYGEWTTTFSNGEPPEPLDPSTGFAGFVLATNFGLEGFPSDDGRFVNMVTVMPVYPEELALAKQENGIAELLQRFEKHKIGPGFRPGRRNVAVEPNGGRGFLGGLFRRGK